jgi:tRNA pseudouridine13 synthase
VLTFNSSPEHFTVEEIAAYPPSGEGAHTFLWIEKRGLTTFDAIARIAAALKVAPRDMGYAGLKDRHALTRQWLSIPGKFEVGTFKMGTLEGSPNPPAMGPARQSLSVPDAKMGTLPYPFGDDLTVLAAVPHPHKLRLGHLRGNRFEVVLTGSATLAEVDALATRFAALVGSGVPNRFGAQRFGAGGDNASAGLALLRGERRERDRRRRRLLLSALQSAVFNRALELRAATGDLAQVRPGDVLQKTASGGLFVSTDPAIDQARVASGEIVPTGPLPGGREIEPPPDTPARAIEDQAIADVGATREDFARAGRELPGARRPVLLKVTVESEGFVREPVGAGPDQPGDPDARARAVRLAFALPAGGYATVLIEALLGGPT